MVQGRDSPRDDVAAGDTMRLLVCSLIPALKFVPRDVPRVVQVASSIEMVVWRRAVGGYNMDRSWERR